MERFSFVSFIREDSISVVWNGLPKEQFVHYEHYLSSNNTRLFYFSAFSCVPLLWLELVYIYKLNLANMGTTYTVSGKHYPSL